MGRLGRVQKTAAEKVRSGVWENSIARENWKTYTGSTSTVDKKGHVNSNGHMMTVFNEDRESISLNSKSAAILTHYVCKQKLDQGYSPTTVLSTSSLLLSLDKVQTFGTLKYHAADQQKHKTT